MPQVVASSRGQHPSSPRPLLMQIAPIGQHPPAQHSPAAQQPRSRGQVTLLMAVTWAQSETGEGRMVWEVESGAITKTAARTWRGYISIYDDVGVGIKKMSERQCEMPQVTEVMAGLSGEDKTVVGPPLLGFREVRGIGYSWRPASVN
jgi:hypothetical protein